MDINIRREEEKDRRIVEELTREAFWNLHVPGCDEHYLVHLLRTHPDFIPELNFVAELNGTIVGNIMYTKSAIIDKTGGTVETLTFGPLSVLPDFQRKGIGSALIQHTLDIARSQEYPAVIIHGHPKNYIRSGFKISKDFGISDTDNRYPYHLLVAELHPGAIPTGAWKYTESNAYCYDIEAFDAFDVTFPRKKKEVTYTQYEFTITSKAYVE